MDYTICKVSDDYEISENKVKDIFSLAEKTGWNYLSKESCWECLVFKCGSDREYFGGLNEIICYMIKESEDVLECAYEKELIPYTVYYDVKQRFLDTNREEVEEIKLCEYWENI